VDKFTLAALEATLRHYRDENEAWREIPTLRALREPAQTTKQRGQKLRRLIGAIPAKIEIALCEAQAGAGSLPTTTVPSFALKIKPEAISLEEFARRLRLGEPSIWGYIRENAFWLDCRTIQDEELKECAVVIQKAL
jgi:L-seryl-tRNA(Ser) seleniumtransferase